MEQGFTGTDHRRDWVIGALCYGPTKTSKNDQVGAFIKPISQMGKLAHPPKSQQVSMEAQGRSRTLRLRAGDFGLQTACEPNLARHLLL